MVLQQFVRLPQLFEIGSDLPLNLSGSGVSARIGGLFFDEAEAREYPQCIGIGREKRLNA